LTKLQIYGRNTSRIFDITVALSGMEVFMTTTAHRLYAHPFDRTTEGPADQHGVGRSNEAIGGYFGIGWYSYFLDHRTGERFRVHCSDGVYGGKDAYPDSILPWMEVQYRAIIDRTIAEAEAGVSEIRISTQEWNIMLTRVHTGWLDGEDTRKHISQDEGQIGTCRGVPVIVDTKMDCPLDEPPE
jgi:hypothetical protein